jgi:CRISPR-associated protein Cmr6
MSTYQNIGLLFNKHYFKDINWSNEIDSVANQGELKRKNEDLFASPLEQGNVPEINGNLKNFKLKTIYPGLFSGSGYAHESSIEGELKLGFYFDHTSGVPCLPGSSVKGVLAQAFDTPEYIRSILKELGMGKRKSDYEVEFKDLKWDAIPANLKTLIFGDQSCYESIYKRDIFFDAFPVSVNQKLLGNDYITPHKNPLKNPIPLQFMKVMPEVEFEFRFILHDTNGLTANMKLELFRQILLDMGIGAKTNVGYGQFEAFIDTRKKLEDINVEDTLRCEIMDTIFRENDSKYQIYLKPEIFDYDKFLSKLKKPFPSIRIDKYTNDEIQNKTHLVCKVKKIENDGRVLFDRDFIGSE